MYVLWSHALFLLQTDYEGQAKKLMELMENTDMLIVAGGDGTLQEVTLLLFRFITSYVSCLVLCSLYNPVDVFVQVVTGLLRRPDEVRDFLIIVWVW